MPSGWVRWMFEQQFQFPTFEVVYPPQLDAGNLKAKYDVIIFTGGIPATDAAPRRPRRRSGQRAADQPAAGVGGQGRDGDGGEDHPCSSSSSWRRAGRSSRSAARPYIAYHLGLPVANHLVERTAAGALRPLPSEKYFVPGAARDGGRGQHEPAGVRDAGQGGCHLQPEPDVPAGAGRRARGARRPWRGMTARSRCTAAGAGARPTSRAASESSRRASGRARSSSSARRSPSGGEPHGTFPFLFNGIYYGAAQSVPLAGARGAAR